MIGSTLSHCKVLDKFGESGMGVVYNAEDTKLDRSVALKFLPNHLLGDEVVRKRFEREATQGFRALSHSNVFTVLESSLKLCTEFVTVAPFSSLKCAPASWLFRSSK